MKRAIEILNFRIVLLILSMALALSVNAQEATQKAFLFNDSNSLESLQATTAAFIETQLEKSNQPHVKNEVRVRRIFKKEILRESPELDSDKLQNEIEKLFLIGLKTSRKSFAVEAAKILLGQFLKNPQLGLSKGAKISRISKLDRLQNNGGSGFFSPAIEFIRSKNNCDSYEYISENLVIVTIKGLLEHSRTSHQSSVEAGVYHPPIFNGETQMRLTVSTILGKEIKKPFNIDYFLEFNDPEEVGREFAKFVFGGSRVIFFDEDELSNQDSRSKLWLNFILTHELQHVLDLQSPQNLKSAEAGLSPFEKLNFSNWFFSPLEKSANRSAFQFLKEQGYDFFEILSILTEGWSPNQPLPASILDELYRWYQE